MSLRTRDALINWGRGDAASAYLACGVLRLEGATDVDPVHPQGGPDGNVDIFCSYQGVRCVVGVHFPNNSTTVAFNKIEKKFRSDLAGVSTNGRDGFLFVTNANVTKLEKRDLEAHGTAANCKLCLVFNLERLVAVFDDPRSYGLREEYLGIAMTRAEEIALQHANRLEDRQYREQHAREITEIKSVLASIAAQIDPKGGSR